MKLLAALFLAIPVIVLPATGTLADNPHQLFETRCGRCHDMHAGPFARKKLELKNGEAVSARSNNDIRRYLEWGHGKLTDAEISQIVLLFEEILRSDGLFAQKCAICHGRGYTFARNDLTYRDGKLVGRYSGRDINAFLAWHGRLESYEIATITGLFVRQLEYSDSK